MDKKQTKKDYNTFIKVERIKDGLIMMVPKGAAEDKHFRRLDKMADHDTKKNLEAARLEAGIIETPKDTMPDIEDPEEGYEEITSTPDFITEEECEAMSYQELRSKAREYKPDLKGKNKKEFLVSICTGTYQ